MRIILRWFGKNLTSLILAFILAVTVWVSAVVSADPNEERTLRLIDLDIIGQPAEMVIVNTIPDQVRLTLNAPKSIWAQLTNKPGLAHAWIDLTGLSEGTHTVEVKIKIDIQPYQKIGVEPDEVKVTLEPLLRRTFSIQLKTRGELPLGYKTGDAQIESQNVVISGPASSVNRVQLVKAELNVAGSIETIKKSITLEFLDIDGKTVTGITSSANEVTVTEPINLLGRFKNVAVKVVTTGQVANGYRLTNISVSPPTFTAFSENPELINEIPGYVETMPVDLTGLVDDVTASVELNLPAGITTVREPSVMIQVSVSAIEGSMTISLPLEVVGLPEELSALLSPGSVDVIVAGPLNALDLLTADDFQVTLDLTGLPAGVYQRTPVVVAAPKLIRIQTTLPETVEVTIEEVATPTPTPIGQTPPSSGNPALNTPTPSATPMSGLVPGLLLSMIFKQGLYQ